MSNAFAGRLVLSCVSESLHAFVGKVRLEAKIRLAPEEAGWPRHCLARRASGSNFVLAQQPFISGRPGKSGQ